MQQISVQELLSILQAGTAVQLIDVREPYEHAEYNIGGQLIPLAEIGRRVNEIATDRPVVMYCRKGIRSQIAIQKLQDRIPGANLINLSGGMEAWKKAVGA